MMKTVTGSFNTYDQAQDLVRRLKDLGLGETDINIVTATVAKERVAGASAGLASAVGGLAIPGVGPIMTTGPTVGTLVGGGMGAASGGLVAGLTDLGIPEAD